MLKTAGTRTRYCSFKLYNCPVCGCESSRHSTNMRCVYDISEISSCVIVVIYSKHYCTKCRKNFTVPMPNFIKKGYQYTNKVVEKALATYKLEGSLERTSLKMLKKYHIKIAPTTLYGWVLKTRGEHR